MNRLKKGVLAAALLFCIGLGMVLYYPQYAISNSYILTLNSDTSQVLPKQFRMTPEHASGSAQFSADGLKRMLQVIPHKRVIIFDLREESHGFLNDNAVSWYGTNNWLNHGKSRDQIISEEKQHLDDLSNKYYAIVYRDRQYPVPSIVRSVSSEEELVKKYGAEYYRLPIRDHVRPNDETVDEFVAFVKSLNGEAWLHFHCMAGKGRTTTLLTICDMMQNASKNSLEEIVSRQKFYGGTDLFDEHAGTWKESYMRDRTAFIAQFYQYAKENPDFKISWSEWVKALK